MTLAISGGQYEIGAGSLQAVVTGAGAGLRELRAGSLPLIDGYAPDDPCPGGHGQLLIPWPNRVDGGCYTFRGAEHQLDISEPNSGNALHGLVRWAGWQVAEHDIHRVRLTYRLLGHPGYPYALDLTAVYSLDAREGLAVTITATNVGSTPAPYGVGAHPYLSVGVPAIDDCLLTLPASTRLAAGERGIPAGKETVDGTDYDFREARPVGRLRLDHAFTDLLRDPGGRSWTHLHAPDSSTVVSLWADESYRWLQLFTGDHLPQPERQRTALAVEPMSCPPAAFNTGEDLITLSPGETTTSNWGITYALH